jgi:hypothetical protein
MEAPNETTEQPEKPKRKRPMWKFWLKNRFSTLHDAVALSMNVSPKSIDKLLSTDSKARTAYTNRLAAALKEAHQKGVIAVVEKGSAPDGNDTTIGLASFVSFAKAREWTKLTEEFLLLGSTEIYGASNTTSKPPANRNKAPESFVKALIRLLVEIAIAETKAGRQFNVDEMPGTRKDLLELATKMDPEFKHTQRTFEDYIEGFCKFKSGTKSNGYYLKLFPDFSVFAHNVAKQNA